eukprot:COSAG02_NODE_66_length_42609_cov_95.996848_20_plen_58_part_00
MWPASLALPPCREALHCCVEGRPPMVPTCASCVRAGGGVAPRSLRTRTVGRACPVRS